MKTCAGIANSDYQDAGSNVELSTSTGPAASSQSLGADMPVDPSKVHEMLRMMQDNPGMLQDMRAAVANMTPEQIQAAVCVLPILQIYCSINGMSINCCSSSALCSHSCSTVK